MGIIHRRITSTSYPSRNFAPPWLSFLTCILYFWDHSLSACAYFIAHLLLRGYFPQNRILQTSGLLLPSRSYILEVNIVLSPNRILFSICNFELNLHDAFLPTTNLSCVSDQLFYFCLPLLCRGCSSNSVLYCRPCFHSLQHTSYPRTGSYFDLIF